MRCPCGEGHSRSKAELLKQRARHHLAQCLRLCRCRTKLSLLKKKIRRGGFGENGNGASPCDSMDDVKGLRATEYSVSTGLFSLPFSFTVKKVETVAFPC